MAGTLRFGTSRHPAPPFRAVFGIMSQSLMPFFVDRICCSRDLVFIRTGRRACRPWQQCLGSAKMRTQAVFGPRKLWLRNKDGRVAEDMVAGLTSRFGADLDTMPQYERTATPSASTSKLLAHQPPQQSAVFRQRFHGNQEANHEPDRPRVCSSGGSSGSLPPERLEAWKKHEIPARNEGAQRHGSVW